ncbi:MAG: patatin-like phospholipase family protein [Acidobacteriota bacterium]
MAPRDGQPDRPLRHVDDLEEVIEAERAHVDARRKAHPPLTGDATPEALWGLAFSGGGVRSATFCLGVLQSLIKQGLFRRFDYLSTVSGGGYIGSCLSSLLTRDRDGRKKDVGVDEASSPFVGLHEVKRDLPAGQTRLSVRHQLHHLRRHGEYLSIRTDLFSRDLQRALGVAVSGALQHFILFFLLLAFIAGLTHAYLYQIDPERVLLGRHHAPPVETQLLATDSEGLTDQVLLWLKSWYHSAIADPVSDLFSLERLGLPLSSPGFLAGEPTRVLLWLSVLAGLLWVGGALFVLRRLNRWKLPQRHVPAGTTARDHLESRFVLTFNLLSMLMGIVLPMAAAQCLRDGPSGPRLSSGVALLMPFAFAIGGRVATLIVRLVESRGTTDRKLRSLLDSLQGAAGLGLAASVLMPVFFVALMAVPDLELAKLVGAGIVLYIGRRELAGDHRTGLSSKLLGPAVFGASALLFSILFIQLAHLEVRLDAEPRSFYFIVIAVSFGALFTVAWAFDANRVSPHRFYRDRLTEAYLRTTATVDRPADDDRQGQPLIILRDDEHLRLSQLHDGDAHGPYHLINGALNLQGTKELSRKTQKSEHFLFSKLYCGSRVTGYSPTANYRGDQTTLAEAMTISAAAAGSAMGQSSSLTLSFVALLFNVRLGTWLENPWLDRHGPGGTRPSPWTFWPKYLCHELFNQTTAASRLVNVSDGGHSGDNLGLLPLLQRRCQVIGVVDAEADPEHIFESLSNAVRLVYIEENIEVKINLGPIVRQAEEGSDKRQASHAVGDIIYPATATRPASRGRLIYLKASLSEVEREAESELAWKIPAAVKNYARHHPDFPHQSTADQFFDAAQWESYRSLGTHVGRQAAPELQHALTEGPEAFQPELLD